jgi:hypothetical protein
VITPLDKYRTLKAAEAVGFPCPKTYLPRDEGELRQIADELEFPLVIKPRFTAAGRGTNIVRNFSELLEKVRPTIVSHGMPLLQAYIPGDLGEYIHIVMDKTGTLKMAVHKRFQRYFRKQAFPVYRESIPPQPYAKLAGQFLKGIGWWGGAVVEIRIDCRDNSPKLMEINPRFGSGLLELTEIGINAPRMCLRIARREEVEAVENYPISVCLHPIDDALIFGLRFLNLLVSRFATLINGKTASNLFDPPTSWCQLIQPYRYAYLSGKKVTLDPKIKLFVQEPVASIISWLQRFASVWAAVGDLGGSLFREILRIQHRRPKTASQGSS